MEHLFLIFPEEMFAHPNRPYMSSEHIPYIFFSLVAIPDLRGTVHWRRVQIKK
jgi:hypothetical protein